MSRLVTHATLAVVLLLPGCVAMDYGPITPERPYGYSEMKREDGVYILVVAFPDANEAMAFWDRRATELCGSSAFTKNIYQAVRPTVVSTYGGTAGAAVLEGLLTCNIAPVTPAESSPQ